MTGMYIHGIGEMTHDEWAAIAPRETVSQMLTHPESGSMLYMGGTPSDEDFWYGKGYAAAQSKTYTRDRFDVRVNLYGGALGCGPKVTEIRVPINDGSLDEEPLLLVNETADLAYDLWASGKRVVVNCQAGLNRSGLITALVLRQTGMTSEEAINLIRTKRSQACLCNDHFVEYLLLLDEIDQSEQSA